MNPTLPPLILLAAALPGVDEQGAAADEAHLKPVLALLSPEQRHGIGRSRRASDRALRLLVRALLAVGMEALAGWPTAETLRQLRYGAHGRPELCSPDWSLNFSHSRPWAVCALGRASLVGTVGVDVEAEQPLQEADFQAVFNSQELSAIAAASLPCRELIRRWTIKEALLKMAGNGFLGEPQGIDTSSFEANGATAAASGGCWRHVFLARGYWLTVAASRSCASLTLRCPAFHDCLPEDVQT